MPPSIDTNAIQAPSGETVADRAPTPPVAMRRGDSTWEASMIQGSPFRVRRSEITRRELDPGMLRGSYSDQRIRRESGVATSLSDPAADVSVESSCVVWQVDQTMRSW